MALAKGSMDASQAEFAQLQREYRHMELNRKSYADESYGVLRKQQATIQKLRRDNERLKGELAAETRTSTKGPNGLDEAKRSARLMEEVEKYERNVFDETKKLEQLDGQIHTTRDAMNKLRREMGGVNAARENNQMVAKQVKILENRLDQALVKFNQSLAQNKKLREDIDDLRRERVVFDSIYRKLEKELGEKKRQMANVIEISNNAYEHRDNYQLEIAAIEQANSREQDEFEAQMVELGRILETELKPPAPPERARTATAGSPSRKKRSSAEELEREREELARGEERVQNFEEAFNRIKAATGIEEIDELVRLFVKNEDQNFSLFNYVTEQTNEIEKLQDAISQLQEEEAKYASQGGADVEKHELIVADLEKRVRETESSAEKYESKCEEYQKIVDQLKKAIASTFTKTECPRTAAFADSAVTENNMLDYLAAIEERANAIISDYAEVKVRQREEARDEIQETGPMPSVLGMGPTTPMGQDLIHVNPPKLEDYSSEEEDDNDDTRPLTRDEIKAKTLTKMYQRSKAGDPVTTKSRKKKASRSSF